MGVDYNYCINCKECYPDVLGECPLSLYYENEKYKEIHRLEEVECKQCQELICLKCIINDLKIKVRQSVSGGDIYNDLTPNDKLRIIKKIGCLIESGDKSFGLWSNKSRKKYYNYSSNIYCSDCSEINSISLNKFISIEEIIREKINKKNCKCKCCKELKRIIF
jgi:hypothetical protein